MSIVRLLGHMAQVAGIASLPGAILSCMVASVKETGRTISNRGIEHTGLFACWPSGGKHEVS